MKTKTRKKTFFGLEAFTELSCKEVCSCRKKRAFTPVPYIFSRPLTWFQDLESKNTDCYHNLKCRYYLEPPPDPSRSASGRIIMFFMFLPLKMSYVAQQRVVMSWLVRELAHRHKAMTATQKPGELRHRKRSF